MTPTEAERAACDCGIVKQADYAAARKRHGVETHSPYCPVGRIERATHGEETHGRDR